MLMAEDWKWGLREWNEKFLDVLTVAEGESSSIGASFNGGLARFGFAFASQNETMIIIKQHLTGNWYSKKRPLKCSSVLANLEKSVRMTQI